MIKTWEDLIPYQEPEVSTPLTLIANGKQFYFHGEITFLINAVFYFFECVYIMVVPGGFRLVVMHHNQLILDKTFQSLRGARIAFAKLFRKKAWKEDVFPEWSEFYEPEYNWSKKITDPIDSTSLPIPDDDPDPDNDNNDLLLPFIDR